MIAGARDTVNIDESTHYIYKELTDGTDPVTVPFKTMKDVFLWAAILGYMRGEKRQISGKKLTIFRWAQFSVQTDMPIVKAICLASESNIDVLLNQEDILIAVEEYANAGINDLRTSILQNHGQPLWNLTSLL